jgi:peptide/nickel transport system substrate-binding protein
MYLDIQKKLQEEGPYAIMFQQVEQSVKDKDVEGYVSGPTFDLIFYRTITK